MIDAVIRTGGKQYRVHEGSVLNVATMEAEPGSRVELHDVLLVSHEGSVTVGSPIVDGAVVVAEVVEHGRGPKVISFKYKAKVRYRRKRGHRQGFTTLSVREITANGVTVTAPERPERPAPATTGLDMSERPAGFAGRVESERPVATAPVAEDEEEAQETPEEEAPSAEEPSTPRPRRRRRTTTSESSEEQAQE